MYPAIVDMHTVLSHRDPEVRITYRRSVLLDLLRRLGKGMPVVNLKQAVAIATRQIRVVLGSVHHAAGKIMLCHCASGVWTHLHNEHVADRKLGADSH